MKSRPSLKEEFREPCLIVAGAPSRTAGDAPREACVDMSLAQSTRRTRGPKLCQSPFELPKAVLLNGRPVMQVRRSQSFDFPFQGRRPSLRRFSPLNAGEALARFAQTLGAIRTVASLKRKHVLGRLRLGRLCGLRSSKHQAAGRKDAGRMPSIGQWIATRNAPLRCTARIGCFADFGGASRTPVAEGGGAL